MPQSPVGHLLSVCRSQLPRAALSRAPGPTPCSKASCLPTAVQGPCALSGALTRHTFLLSWVLSTDSSHRAAPDPDSLGLHVPAFGPRKAGLTQDYRVSLFLGNPFCPAENSCFFDFVQFCSDLWQQGHASPNYFIVAKSNCLVLFIKLLCYYK